MKFFWKLYFSIMAITLTCFSFGGYMLIQTGFNNSFDREIDSAYQENDILVNSLSLELSPVWQGDGVDAFVDVNEKYQYLQKIVANIKFETFRGSMSFCVRSEDGKLIYQNGGFSDDPEIVNEITQNERGYIINNKDNKYSLRCIRVFTFAGTDLYIENMRDVSELFINRGVQFQTLFYYTLILSLASGILIFIVTRWLVKPIKRLSQATKAVASGTTIEPVVVHSNDEIGQLTKDFNTMTVRLATTMKELQEAVERQQIFVGNFAHELKTPLTSIIGYGDMLRSKRLDEEKVISYSNLIVEEGKRLELMSMKLLELIVLKKRDFKMYLISAELFLQGVVDTVSLMMKDSGIDFVVEIEQGQLYVEPDLMKTVCLNLLDNARKAVSQNGKIILKGRALCNGYEISICDNGQGIATEELDKIKEAFYMVDKSRSRSAGGVGLGLAICEQIVQLHHTTIQIESTLGAGTTVKVVLKGDEINEKI